MNNITMSHNHKNGHISVAAIVVTFNRKQILSQCLRRLLSQTYTLDKIIIIDNASTDGTQEMLLEQGFLEQVKIEVIQLSENIGGAGGFYTGVCHAIEEGYDWFWLMDDDAIADNDALEALLVSQITPKNVYASASRYIDEDGKEMLCWPITLDRKDSSGKKIIVDKYVDLNDMEKVSTVPFLGFFISRQLIEIIGPPDKDFFISCDDVEYCERAKRKAKAKIILVKQSKLCHPSPMQYRVHLIGRCFVCQRLHPWRRYYDVRNHILVAKTYYGYRLWTETIPGLLVRLVATLRYEPDRLRQIRAYSQGGLDGLLGRGGNKIQPGKL